MAKRGPKPRQRFAGGTQETASERLSIALTPSEKEQLRSIAERHGKKFDGMADFWRYWIFQMVDTLSYQYPVMDKNEP